MKKIAHKSELLDTIVAARRQLDRYLFFFEQDSTGEFIASERFKFSEVEATAPGALGSWSLEQALVQLLSSEQAFLHARRPGDLVPAGAPAEPVRTSAAETLPITLQKYRASFQEILAYVRNLPEAALFSPQPTPLVDEVIAATCRRYDRAKEQIRRWRTAHSGQQMNKALLLERIQSERRRLEKTLARLDQAQMIGPGVIGAWSVKDILAHLAAWEQLFLGWYQAGLRGEKPPLPAAGFTWREMDRLNEQIYQRHCPCSLEEVQEQFASSYIQALQVIQAIPEGDLFAPGRYEWQGKHSLVEYVLANTANHYRWANRKICAWRASGIHLDNQP